MDSLISLLEDVVEGRETDEPIKGAIDYILLPLAMLGITGPIFVIMYIVMASVEFRLPPNTQGGRNFLGIYY
ncbi:unnamed protein product [Orchesella dallaii]|uniref:Sugar ABC transporter permease n=1 Tax=Orchesella dallaii TaxID=48710 RepID=A0ABP1QXE3_9HEXA